MRKKIFINLTSGIEAIEIYNLNQKEISFIRIQSSHCESHKWELILNQLDNNFLMFAAMGWECLVYDFGSQNELSKAIYIGLEWIKLVLHKRWLDVDYPIIIKNKNVTEYYEDEYKKLSKSCRWRLDYFKKFLLTKQINISGITSKTQNDNNYDYFRGILAKHYV